MCSSSSTVDWNTAIKGTSQGTGGTSPVKIRDVLREITIRIILFIDSLLSMRLTLLIATHYTIIYHKFIEIQYL